MASIKQSRTSEVVRFIHVDADAGKKFDGIHPVLFCSNLQQRVAVDFLVDISAERVEREKMLLVAIWKSVGVILRQLRAAPTRPVTFSRRALPGSPRRQRLTTGASSAVGRCPQEDSQRRYWNIELEDRGALAVPAPTYRPANLPTATKSEPGLYQFLDRNALIF